MKKSTTSTESNVLRLAESLRDKRLAESLRRVLGAPSRLALRLRGEQTPEAERVARILRACNAVYGEAR